jgi:NitT/TauT family transport system substrate-binding protein
VIRTVNSQTLAASSADFWAGKFLGYYEEEGVDPEVQGTTGAPQGLHFLLTGKSTLAEAVQDGLLSMAARGEQPAARLVYNHTRGMVNQVGVLPDGPIKDYADLRGQRVGVYSLTHSGVSYLRVILREAGLNADMDVSLVAVGGGAQAGGALQQGDVAALVLWDTEYVWLDHAGFRTRLLPHPPSVKSITGGQATAVTLDYLRNNRKVVVGTLRAQARTTAFRLANPAALVRIHWMMYPQSRPPGKPEDVALKEEVDAIAVRNPRLEPRAYGLKFGEFDPAGWQAYARFLGLDNQLNVNDWITNDLVEEINTFDRAKIEEQARAFKG